ncbi:hypothetical protein BHF71_08530 [Vulcanibacillus modesticaldus]|uniref:Uncharacterized protein n=1 Tax=Vulcanibacillus modesticaldus TaxID=337097 RepID=A0A1D2YV40_9BACI|nr:hypothetical protein [Vulcanibacillus modesticaldus]OEF99582.1 hypothetical protein BHF71_08530 [Vulcanibacillus modesticaldus]
MRYDIIFNRWKIRNYVAFVLVLALLFQVIAPATQAYTKAISGETTTNSKTKKPQAYQTQTDLGRGKYRIDYWDYRWEEPKYKEVEETKKEWVPRWEKKEWVTVKRGY